VPGRVSIEVDALLPGPHPHTAQLLVVFPPKLFDRQSKPGISVARGVQWWNPGTLPKLKLANHTTSPKTIAAHVQVAMAYGTNCDDVERMVLPKQTY